MLGVLAMNEGALREMRLTAMPPVAEGTTLFAFRALDGGELPGIEPGAHIDLHLPTGMVRQYSLVIDDDDRRKYVVAIKKDRESRGGSRLLHEEIGVGTVLRVGGPRNLFPLVDDASHTVFVAGGIGITPIWSMVRKLEQLGRTYELHYACRPRGEMAFYSSLSARPGVHLHIDEERGGLLDVPSICSNAPADAHLYCCGPGPLLANFEAATSGRPADRIHVEYFGARQKPTVESGFEVELFQSKQVVKVNPGQTILDALRRAGISVAVSCEQGVCGSCETTVIEGVPDHRCEVLSETDRDAGNTMMICCSGAKSSRLVLDI
jgi:ferredoxin-NADP reductase